MFQQALWCVDPDEEVEGREVGLLLLKSMTGAGLNKLGPSASSAKVLLNLLGMVISFWAPRSRLAGAGGMETLIAEKPSRRGQTEERCVANLPQESPICLGNGPRRLAMDHATTAATTSRLEPS
jgi:hypothetical protein